MSDLKMDSDELVKVFCAATDMQEQAQCVDESMRGYGESLSTLEKGFAAIYSTIAKVEDLEERAAILSRVARCKEALSIAVVANQRAHKEHAEGIARLALAFEEIETAVGAVK